MDAALRSLEKHLLQETIDARRNRDKILPVTRADGSFTTDFEEVKKLLSVIFRTCLKLVPHVLLTRMRSLPIYLETTLRGEVPEYGQRYY
ncbi:unnamed protein product [Ilex paraguariensis]|uniref:Uncharacterized protein n=1 Tax=Ilex paraguariensis TaxID=185542 RepID=A0ABC8STA0_9AQUA